MWDTHPRTEIFLETICTEIYRETYQRAVSVGHTPTNRSEASYPETYTQNELRNLTSDKNFTSWHTSQQTNKNACKYSRKISDIWQPGTYSHKELRLHTLSYTVTKHQSPHTLGHALRSEHSPPGKIPSNNSGPCSFTSEKIRLFTLSDKYPQADEEIPTWDIHLASHPASFHQQTHQRETYQQICLMNTTRQTQTNRTRNLTSWDLNPEMDQRS